MHLLHTADWHLGRMLHRLPLLDAQAVVLNHLVDLARAEEVDAIVLAGDVFDRALPPVEAVQLAGDALRRLAEVAPVVVISGNHDSAQRLGFAAELIAAGGVHLRTDPRGCADPVVLQDEHGPVALYGIPYLDPDLCREPLEVTERSHEAVLGAALTRARDDLAGRDETRGVVIAHAFVQGGAPSESERDISIGGAQTVPASLFDGFAYTALGHLHRPHAIGGTEQPVAVAVGAPEEVEGLADVSGAEAVGADEGVAGRSNASVAEAFHSDEATLPLFDDAALLGDAAVPTVTEEPPGGLPGSPLLRASVRYAGSPLPYSFTEADAEKTTAIVDIDAEGAVAVRLVPVPVPFVLARVRGELEELLEDPRLTEHEAEDHWLEVTLTDARLPARPMEQLRRRFPRVLVLQHRPDGELAPATVAAARVQGRSDLQVLERFVADVRGSEADSDEASLLRDAVEHVTRSTERR